MTSETSRIEAFSDGVFSIAATLLVLELKPPAAGLPFWQGLAQQWPEFVSFLLSFLFIGIMWINHHRLFTHIRRTSDGLMATNLLLLLGVVWIPYPTMLLAQAWRAGQPKDAAILYNASYLAIALLFNLLLHSSTRCGVMDRRHEGVMGIVRQYASGPVMYLICLLLTWWSVPLSLGINFSIAAYFLLAPRRARE